MKMPKTRRFDGLPLVRAHMDALLHRGTDRYGPRHSPAWVASLDLRTGSYPTNAPHAPLGQRVYRDIDTPFGSSLYWDQPLLVTAYNLSRMTGDASYATAADAYLLDFVAHCTGDTGLFQWGNHLYYDVFKDEVAAFHGGPHEMRPIPPAWEPFLRLAPEQTVKHMRAAAQRHVFDRQTGGFNRHDDGRPGCAFLESGGILVEMLTWLGVHTRDTAAFDLAERVAEFSYRHRNPTTGLVENNPTTTRWDKWVCTTEIGLWAGSLLRASDLARRPGLAKMARDSVAAYLAHGYDEKTQRYFGQLNVCDGQPPNIDPEACPGRDLFYQPARYSDPWNAFFPTHDYPLALAQTCVELHQRFRDPLFEEGIERWATVLRMTPPPKRTGQGHGEYAELYGRAIHFLASAARATGNETYAEQAVAMAQTAKDRLFNGEMFRSHAGEERIDAVDGLGFLLLALLTLHSGQPTQGMGFGF